MEFLVFIDVFPDEFLIGGGRLAEHEGDDGVDFAEHAGFGCGEGGEFLLGGGGGGAGEAAEGEGVFAEFGCDEVVHCCGGGGVEGVGVEGLGDLFRKRSVKVGTERGRCRGDGSWE